MASIKPFTSHRGFFKNFYDPFGLVGGKKKNKNNNDGLQTIEKQPYAGIRPYTGQEYRDLPTSKQYEGQITERSRGEGLVGFDSGYRKTLRDEYLSDFGDYEADVMKKASAQSSGQGLRGGIPLSIGAEHTKNLSRARQSGLADIDIRGMEARREDIRDYTMAQPQFSNYISDNQGRRANFDLSEYEATLPTYLLDEPQQPSNVLPALIGAAGTIGGAYFGGPAGAAVGSQAGSYLGNQLSQPSGRQRLTNSLYDDPYVQQRRGLSFRY